MLHDLANDDGFVLVRCTVLHSNEQRMTEEDGDQENVCQKPTLQQKITDDEFLTCQML